jgi:L-lactate dehydrogenase complex protein LldG
LGDTIAASGVGLDGCARLAGAGCEELCAVVERPGPEGRSMTREQMLQRVRTALGRSQSPSQIPEPPTIDEPTVRLVHADLGLPELFVVRARENSFETSAVYPEELGAQVVEFLRLQNCRRIVLPRATLLEGLDLPNQFRTAGLELRYGDELKLDDLYDVDASVTDAWAAVAETGSLVVRGCKTHPKSLSLIPPVHVAILEPKNFVGDLVDLFEKLSREGTGNNTVIISGPSKTADIEMTLVTGVHGPGVVRIFVLK